MPQPPTMLLTNSDAGSATEERIRAAIDVLRSEGDLIRRTCDDPDDLFGVFDDFDGDRVVVAGGDGSLHTLLNVLERLRRLDDVVIGLLPLGTGNDFARGLGLPTDPAAAARACLRGRPTPMDLIVADDGEVVVNAAHAGAGAIASQRAQPLKPVAGALAYPLTALTTAATTPGYEVRVTLDGRVVHDGPAIMALVANGPSLGGGTWLTPTADPADGVLDLLVIGDVPLADRPGLALALQQGEAPAHDAVRRHRGDVVHVDGQPTDHSRDGELRHDVGDATYRVRAGGWTLLREDDRTPDGRGREPRATGDRARHANGDPSP